MQSDLDKNKALCLAPWASIHTWPDGKTFPCCLWDSSDPIGNVNDSTLEELWNSPKIKNARLKMLAGEKVKSCNRCYSLEDMGEGSYRQGINKRHSKAISELTKTKEDGSLDEMKLYLWDVRLSNFCNFKCRSCGAELSSSWHSDTLKLGASSEQYPKALINISDRSSFLDMLEPHYQHVDEIYFAGGEPLLMPEHYTILNKLIELGRTDVMIRYSTNFSKLTFNKIHIFDLWKHFSNIQIYVSIDGVGKIGEYVRKGFNDKEFDNNIKSLTNSNFEPKELGYTITYGVLNYLHLFDLVLEFLKREYILPRYSPKHFRPLIFSPIENPSHYDCKFLPDRYKQAFKDRLDNFHIELEYFKCSESFITDTVTKLTNIYNRSISESFNYSSMEKCVDITKKLDSIRGEEAQDCLPYFSNIEDLLIN